MRHFYDRNGITGWLSLYIGVVAILLITSPILAENNSARALKDICNKVIDHKVAKVGAKAGILNKYKQLEGKKLFCEANIIVIGRTDVISYLVVFLYNEETKKYDAWEISREVLPTFI